MIKSIKTILSQDKEKFVVPKKVQDLIPIKCIWPDGIFKVGNKFSKTYKFSDINYMVASREDKESMFLTYSELLNSLDSGATTKITINNHRLNKADFEDSILMPMKRDGLDGYRMEYNNMLLDKATGANGITQEKYVTISVSKKDVEEARAYFARVGADLTTHFTGLGSKCVALNAVQRLRILHDFYRPGDETAFEMNINKKARMGHDFRDYICPDSVERSADHIKLGEKFARVLFLKDYASYIKDSMLSELTELNRNLMLSIDVIPIPTDEAVREVENRLLGVETNITNWQRKQNQNNNFSAVVPYDMELQRKESHGRYQGAARPGYRDNPLYCEKAHVPDGHAEVPADGRTEHGPSDWRQKDQYVQNPYHREPRGSDAVQGTGDYGPGRYLFR